MATGRTVGRFMKVQITDASATLRDIYVTTINGVGITYPETPLTALQDVLNGFLAGQGTVSLTLTSPFSNLAVQAASGSGAAPAESGFFTVMSALNGLMVPLTLGVYQGIRTYWATGDPVFGIAKTAANGVWVSAFTYDPTTQMCTSKIAMYPGSAAPAWGTAALA
jgi:hypothetical protein